MFTTMVNAQMQFGDNPPKFGTFHLGPCEGGEDWSATGHELLDAVLSRFSCVGPWKVCEWIRCVDIQVLLGSHLGSNRMLGPC